MFPEIDDIPKDKAEMDKWLGSLPTSAFTPKLWYLIGISHMRHEAIPYMAKLFDAFYPIASACAEDNAKESVQ